MKKNGILRHPTDTYDNMDEPQKHYTKRKKTETKCYILYDAVYMKF